MKTYDGQYEYIGVPSVILMYERLVEILINH